VTPAPRETTRPPARGTSLGFIRVAGDHLELNGRVIQLRGTNFANEAARYGSGGLQAIEWDYPEVAQAGANHVRLDFLVSWWEKNPAEFFRIIDKQMAMAKANGIWVIPNVHETPSECVEDYGKTCPIWGDAGEQERLKRFWQAFAQHYRDETAIAGYDILNEPTPSSMNQWWSLAQRIKQTILSVDPNHAVVIESGTDGTFDGSLGPNVIYSVHFYDPVGQLSSELAHPFGPLYVGEFGAPRDYEYIRAVGAFMNRQGLSYANWAWRQTPDAWGIGPKTGPWQVVDASMLDVMRFIWHGGT